MEKLLYWLNPNAIPYITALIQFIAFLILAFLANLFLIKVLKRLAHITKSSVDDRIIDVLQKPVFIIIIILGIYYAINELEITNQTFIYINRAIYSIFSLISVIALFRISKIIIENTINKFFDVKGISKDVVPLTSRLTGFFFLIIFSILILAIWQVDVTPLLASAGILSAIIAFGAKDAIANFFGGLSVFLDKPYRVGDYIELDQKERGEVVEVGIRSTRIKTRDDVLISIPNSIIANSKIINESAPVPNFRMRIPVTIAYGTEIDAVEKLFLKIAFENENVLNEPHPRVRLREFGESGLKFEFLCWTYDPAKRGHIIDQLSREIYKQFNENGIVIPFNQIEVRIKNSA